MLKIKVSSDFSKTPGGRLKIEGPYSGEEFRSELLKPKYIQAIKNNQKLIIDLDDCYGFPTLFIEEAFGGLVRELKDKNILKNMDIICQDEPGLIEDIKKYVNNIKLKGKM